MKTQKHLNSFSIEGVTIQNILYLNTNTDNYCISFNFHSSTVKPNTQRFRFKPTKQLISTNKLIKKGYQRHHIFYDFKRPEAGIVIVSISFHSKIHGNQYMTYGLID